MGIMTNTEKIQLWEKNAYLPYYKMRDIELYLGCLMSSAKDLREFLEKPSDVDLSLDIVQNTLNRLRDRIKETKQVLDDIEKSIE